MIALVVCALAVGQIYGHVEAESGQPTWGIEFRAGPYDPKIGSDDAERDYYELIYQSGDDGSWFKYKPMLKTFEYSRYFWNDVGLLGVTFKVGHWRTEAPTRLCRDATDEPVACTSSTVFDSEEGNDKTTLTVYPVGVGVVYRMDLIKRYVPVIPLVPYGKGSFDYYIWRNTVRGEVSRGDAGKGEGATLGMTAAAGLMLNLDWMEPDAASRARTTGMADSYLYGEASWLIADSFGEADDLDMSDFLVQVGLAVDFL